MSDEKIMQRSEATFGKCPSKVRRQILRGIEALDIRGIKIERELMELSATTGGPPYFHSPTGVVIYTIRGYKTAPKRKGRKK